MACAGRFSDGELKLVLVLSLDKEAMVLRLNELLVVVNRRETGMVPSESLDPHE